MFHNYIVTALRSIARHRLHSFINIAGLAVGLACAIFVLMFIRDELSYDKWVPGTQNLYRLEKTSHLLGRAPLEIATLPFPLLPAMREEIPEVAATTRLYYAFMTLFAGDRQFREHIASVDPNFFQVVKLPLMKGDPASVFRDPESAVLSEKAARKYFGTTDAIGKVIKTTANCAATDAECLGQLLPLKVTGILRDIPENSHLDGDVFMPNTSITDRFDPGAKQSWFAAAVYSYVLLAPGARPETVLAKMAPLLDRNYPAGPDDAAQGKPAFYLLPDAFYRCASARGPLENQRKAGRQLGHALWHGRCRPSDPFCRLFQFHESGDRAGLPSGAGDRAAQDPRGRAGTADRPVSGRGGVDGAAVAGGRAGTGRSPATCFWPPAGASHRGPL